MRLSPEIVLEFAVRMGGEAVSFANYVQTFVDHAFISAMSGDDSAPVVIMRTQPQGDYELKQMIFQRAPDAEAFAKGWAAVKSAVGL
ncbi:MAG: hypothetical protein ACXW3D_09225 [Caulobacteraceae bacterium]